MNNPVVKRQRENAIGTYLDFSRQVRLEPPALPWLRLKTRVAGGHVRLTFVLFNYDCGISIAVTCRNVSLFFNFLQKKTLLYKQYLN